MAMNFPPGFRFHPTDGEIIGVYLANKLFGRQCPLDNVLIHDIDFYKYEPYHLPLCEVMRIANEKEEYYFTSTEERSLSYGRVDTIRRTESNGYWKQIGNDVIIPYNHRIVGCKKEFIFCWGTHPYGIQSRWVMSECRLIPSGFPNETIDDLLLAKIETTAVCRLRLRKYEYGPNSHNEATTVYLPKRVW